MHLPLLWSAATYTTGVGARYCLSYRKHTSETFVKILFFIFLFGIYVYICFKFNINKSIMTDSERQTLKFAENKLQYGRGLCYEEWDILIELRKKLLIEQGKNPSHYDTGSRYCEKKVAFRNL